MQIILITAGLIDGEDGLFNRNAYRAITTFLVFLVFILAIILISSMRKELTNNQLSEEESWTRHEAMRHIFLNDLSLKQVINSVFIL